MVDPTAVAAAAAAAAPDPGQQPEQGPDAHGQASLLLVESLVHGLIAKSVITVADAIEIIDVAAEVKEEVAEQAGESVVKMQRSLALLEALAVSLARDLPA